MKRFIRADLVFPVSSEPIQDAVIVCDENGSIVDVGTISSLSVPEDKLEHHEGIVCPGFINTHCHLELSHTKGMISEGTGISDFITQLLPKRTTVSPENVQLAIEKAEKEMLKNGIVAVGDISNGNESFVQKAKGNIAYHTFIETLAIDPSKAEERFLVSKRLQSELNELGLSSSISPHAAYTMSPALAGLINATEQEMISIHNQESIAESELFESSTGKMFDAFVKLGFDSSLLRRTGTNSLRSSLPLISNAKRILLVHNTFTSPEDIVWAQKEHPGLFWCTCPNANLYIENKLPDYSLLLRYNALITIGTDSLASNHSLSVLDEMRTISRHFPNIPFQTLLTWATKNGAEFLGLDKLGAIEKGKKPGLNLLKGMNGLQFTEQTVVQRIL